MHVPRLRTALAVALLAAVLPAAASSTAAPVHRAGSPARSTGVTVTDIKIRVPDQPAVEAYLVAPAGHARPHKSAGVLWLHWLGQIHNDRTEFLAQAVEMADQGVVSILPMGGFPWAADPDGTAGDVTLVENQLAAYRRVLDRLAGDRAVDPDRIAVVGHDYGAMYGALLADADPRVSALALQALDATWGNWFASYWLGLEGQQRDEYSALFADLDPIGHVDRLGEHVLLQFAGSKDEYVTAEVADAFAAANSHAKRIDYPRADHQLGDLARADLESFLTHELALRH